jgi:hypothetical protein
LAAILLVGEVVLEVELVIDAAHAEVLVLVKTFAAAVSISQARCLACCSRCSSAINFRAFFKWLLPIAGRAVNAVANNALPFRNEI